MADLGKFTGNIGSSGGGGAKGASIETKVGQIKAALQSLKIVIDELRQQGVGAGLIFQSLTPKISELLQAQKSLTSELEKQKIANFGNAEALKKSTAQQAQVQKTIDGTVDAVKSLTKEQIQNSRTAQKAENELAVKRQESANIAKKSNLTLEEEIAQRYRREQDAAEKARIAYEKIEKRKAHINKQNIAELEERQKRQFQTKADQQKQEEKLAKDAAKAKVESDLKAIRSGKGSAKKRLDAEIKYLKEVQKRYKKNSAEFEKLQGRIAEAEGKRRKSTFRGGFLQGLKGLGLGKVLGRLTGIVSVVGTLRAAFRGLQKAVTGSFKAAVNFEAQLAQLQAVTGINNEELGRLEKNVLSVAGSTKFTSEEIVQLQTELGKLGFSVSEIEAATLAVARTAQALGEKVGPVAQRIGQILNQFNLAAAETTRVSDSLVSVINSSALSFEGFSTALQYIGPLGAEVGTTFEETAIAMATLADNGFTASRIGTGLRGILTELSKTGKDLNTVIEDLAEEELTLAEAVDLVGKRNAAQLITLVRTAKAQREVGGSLSDLSDQYFNQGSAAIAAAQQVDTFQGNLDLLKSAVNRVQIAFGNFMKTSKLLRFALKLIDEEGYNAAIAAEAIAAADPTEFSQKLTEAADVVGSLKNDLTDVAEVRAFGKIAARRIVGDTIIKPMENELAMLKKLKQARLDAIEAKQEELRLQQLELPVGSDERNALRQEEINLGIQKAKRTKETIAETQAIESLEKKIEKRKKEGFEAEIEYIQELINEVGLQTALEIERNKVIEERKDILESLQDSRDEETSSLEKANDFNVKVQKEFNDVQTKINNLLAEQNQRKADGNELVGEELLLFNARLEQYKQESNSLSNQVVQRGDLEKLAQKEFEKEFKQLANRIEARKQDLKDEQALLDIAIKTEKNLSKNARTLEERNEATERLSTLQKERLNNETRAFNDLNKITDEYGDLIADIGTEIERAGLDGRFIEKANERLNSFKLGFNALALDIGDIAKAGEDLADALANTYKIDLEAGELDAKQLADVDEKIKDLIRKLLPGLEILSPDAFEAIYQKLQPLVMSRLLPDPKDDEKNRQKKIKKLVDTILDELTDAAKEYNDTILQNTQGRLDAELEAIRNRYKTEEDILKSQLDNQLITESQFRVKSNELKRKQIQEENEINKKKFEAEKKADLVNVAIETAEAIASNLIKNYGSTDTVTATGLTLAGNAALIAGGALKADAIRRRKFFPVTFEEGGMVEGPSHSQGGVPFSVSGQGGYEMEGGEFIVNKKASALHRSLLEKINGSVKPNTNLDVHKFAMGGLVNNANESTINVRTDNRESVNYLKAIAEASVSTAINSNKPLRAFVSNRDLRDSENERRLRERNDRI